MKISTSNLMLFSFCVLTFTACKKGVFEQRASNAQVSQNITATISDTDKYIATSWMDFQLRIIPHITTYVPPVAARTLGYSGITMYEVMVNGAPGHSSLAGQLNGLASLPKPDPLLTYRWSVACNAALAHITRYMYDVASTQDLASLDSLETANNFLLGNDGSDEFARSVAYGISLTDSIIAWSINDRGDHGYRKVFPSRYVPPVGVEYWVPTAVQNSIPIVPFWGSHGTFIRNIAKQTQPVGPLTYSEDNLSDYYATAKDVYDVGVNLTEEQKNIADFWDDPGNSITPPGHSVSILTQLINERDLSLFEASRAYARLGMTLNDAFVSCWKTKFTYNGVRPWTYINKLMDPAWKPYIPTPPHPEFSSGHAVQSGATAIIFNALFGSNTPFTDNTYGLLYGGPRSFANFTAFGDEVALARYYGGIHYYRSCQIGLTQGQAVANKILRLNM